MEEALTSIFSLKARKAARQVVGRGGARPSKHWILRNAIEKLGIDSTLCFPLVFYLDQTVAEKTAGAGWNWLLAGARHGHFGRYGGNFSGIARKGAERTDMGDSRNGVAGRNC